MGRKKSIIKQVADRLDGMTAYGESKYIAKKQAHSKQPPKEKIYSYSTLNNYKAVGCQFARWAKSEHGCRTLDDAEQYVPEYLRQRIKSGLSAWTIKRDASALGKLYQRSGNDFGVSLPSRHLAERTKNRNTVAEYNEARHSDLAELCRSSGLRRHEVANLRGSDIWAAEDGTTKIHVKGKGGRVRVVTCLDNTPRKWASDGSDKRVGIAIPVRAPIHQYRREYAQSLYNRHARPVIPSSDRWVCRGERKGLVFDRAAMRIVSESLGHTRLSIVINYLT